MWPLPFLSRDKESCWNNSLFHCFKLIVKYPKNAYFLSLEAYMIWRVCFVLLLSNRLSLCNPGRSRTPYVRALMVHAYNPHTLRNLKPETLPCWGTRRSWLETWDISNFDGSHDPVSQLRVLLLFSFTFPNIRVIGISVWHFNSTSPEKLYCS